MLWLLSMIRNTGRCYYHQPYVDEIEFFPKFFYYCHFLLIDDWWNMNKKKQINKQTIWCDEQKDLKIVVFWHLVAMGVCVCVLVLVLVWSKAGNLFPLLCRSRNVMLMIGLYIIISRFLTKKKLKSKSNDE